MDKNSLKTLLAEGKTNQVIEALKSLLPRLDEDLEKEVLLQSGRFEYYLSQKRQDTTSTDEQERTRAKINLAVFEIINKIPEEILSEEAQPTQAPAPPLGGGQPFGQLGPAPDVSSKSYAWVSLTAFLIGAVLMALFAFFGQELVGGRLGGQLYYVILIPCALASAAFLFGFMRSYATFTGHMLDKKVELGGPIVGALLVVIGGFYLPGESYFDITVCLKEGRPAQEAIKIGGSVILRHSTGDAPAPFDPNGCAHFKKVSPDKVTFKLAIDGFELAEPNKEYILDKEKRIDLKVKMPDVHGLVRGRVTDFRSGQPLQGVSVTLTTLTPSLTTQTDPQGNFIFNILEENDRTGEYTLRVEKEGYKTDEDVWYTGDGKPFDIRLRPNDQ